MFKNRIEEIQFARNMMNLMVPANFTHISSQNPDEGKAARLAMFMYVVRPLIDTYNSMAFFINERNMSDSRLAIKTIDLDAHTSVNGLPRIKSLDNANQMLDVVVGALSNTWLFDSRDEYRKPAVENFRMAAEALEWLIDSLINPKPF